MNTPESNANPTLVLAEIDQLKRRLAALEAGTVASKRTFGAKLRSRVATKKIPLAIAAVVFVAATIVFGQNAVDSLFVSKGGDVGIGTTSPNGRLDVSGGGVKIGATSDVAPAAGKELVLSPLSGTATGITFQHNGIDSVFLRSDSATRLTSFGAKAGTFLTIDNRDGKVGIGPSAPTAKLDIKDRIVLQDSNGRNYFKDSERNDGKGLRVGALWNQYGVYAESGMGALGGTDGVTLQNGGLTVSSAGLVSTNNDLAVGRFVTSNGRYQRDNNSEVTYSLSTRYHISLTAALYGGSTRQIPQDVINGLCGDVDGCEFRLGMTRWDANSQTETASRSAVMYYSINDGHWRTSLDSIGVDGNNVTEHIMEVWETCYFTDAPYSSYSGQADSARGLYLLVWNGHGNAGRTCELTIID